METSCSALVTTQEHAQEAHAERPGEAAVEVQDDGATNLVRPVHDRSREVGMGPLNRADASVVDQPPWERAGCERECADHRGRREAEDLPCMDREKYVHRQAAAGAWATLDLGGLLNQCGRSV